jgi:SAM-dependent methyltransferase
LVDTGDYATRDMEFYRRLAVVLEEKTGAHPFKAMDGDLPFNEFLRSIRTSYLTAGTASLHDIPSRSVDVIWSQAVLEHIRLEDFTRLLTECRRILAPGGISSHRVDLSDHLGGALNNLRFSRKIWETNLMANAGFYTNRIRCSEMLAAFRAAGFEIESVSKEFWPALPTPRAALDREFSDLSDDELRVKGFDVVLS